MLQLSYEQMLAASRWDAIFPEYLKDENKAFNEGIHPVLAGLKSHGWLSVEHGSRPDGNFFSIFIYDSALYPRFEENNLERKTFYEGVAIYLSCLGSLAVLALSTKFTVKYLTSQEYGITGHSGGGGISLNSNILTSSEKNNAVVSAVFDEASKHGYYFLSKEELSQEIPSEIEPGDSSGMHPPYTYFDLLFNTTD